MTELSQDILDLQSLVSTDWGRRLAYTLIESTGVFAAQFHGDQHELTAYALGQREVGRRLLLSIREHAPGNYLAMLQEALMRDIEAEAQAKKETDDDD